MKNNVRFLSGPHALTSEIVESIIQQYSEKHKDIEIKRYYGAEFNPDDFINEIFENSLFVDYRVVIVHQMELIEKKTWTEKIFPYLKKIPENVFVIFEGILIKTKPKDYEIEIIEDIENIFRKIYRKSYKKTLDATDINEISKFLKTNPYEFAGIIGIIERYLENLLTQKVISEQVFFEKLEYLLDIDFKLKSGKISSEPGWEILLLRLLDIHR